MTTYGTPSMHSDRSTGRLSNVVLLPGWGFKSSIVNSISDCLAERFDTVCLDLPGHGTMECIPRLQASCDAYAAAVAARAPRQALWIGWSLGGLVAMQVALSYPERVQGLVLIASTPQFVRSHEWQAAMAEADFDDFDKDLANDVQRTVTRFCLLQVRHSRNAANTLRYMRVHLAVDDDSAIEGFSAGLRVLRTTSLVSRTCEISSRTLLVYGNNDPLVPTAAGSYLANTIAAAELHIIDGAGHAPFISHPQSFTDLLTGFIESLL